MLITLRRCQVADYFDNSSYLSTLHDQLKLTSETSQQLFRKIGIRPTPKKILLLTIAEADATIGTIVMMTLLEECERIYGKKVDPSSIKYVSLPSLERARNSPYLELADFVLMIDHDLLEIEHYPELEQIIFKK